MAERTELSGEVRQGLIMALRDPALRLGVLYGSVDVQRIWRETPEGVKAMREYAAAIAAYLAPERQP